MQDNYVLIDYENVQPQNIDILSKHPFKIFVFVGADLAKIPLALAEAMQQLGENGRYIKITGNGKNALDFQLAYYLGQLVTQNSEAHFHVISKDTGFDPLIKHLKAQDIRIQRLNDLAEIPVLRMSIGKSSEEKISAIVKNLAGRGQSRPRKTKTLANSINSLFTEQIPEAELLALIDLLVKKNYIAVSEGNVSYKLPH